MAGLVDEIGRVEILNQRLGIDPREKVSTQEFACTADAISAAENLSKTMKWHQLSDIETVEKPHYDKAGKPKKDAVPHRVSYHVTGTLIPIEREIAAQRVRCGRFIIIFKEIEDCN